MTQFNSLTRTTDNNAKFILYYAHTIGISNKTNIFFYFSHFLKVKYFYIDLNGSIMQAVYNL